MVSEYGNRGGAARATQRILKALRMVEKQTGVYAALHFSRGHPRMRHDLPWNHGLVVFRRIASWAKVLASRVFSRALFRPAYPSLHSVANVQTGLIERSVADFDVVHLNWLGDFSLSIEEIGSSPLPVVWTLHDMWPYCGAEHQTLSRRFVEGYLESNRPDGEGGPDINRHTWERKKASWDPAPTVIAPSSWAATNASVSTLFRGSDITIIPHPIDTTFWSPAGAPDTEVPPRADPPIRIAVPAPRESKAWGKGLDLFPSILGYLKQLSHPVQTTEIIFFGGRSLDFMEDGFDFHNRGELSDLELRELYRHVDILAFPSVIDTYGLVAAEAQACGTPVVCFRDTGVESVVRDRVTGYTARLRDVEDFAYGISWVASSPQRLRSLSDSARSHAVAEWHEEAIGLHYAEIFREAAQSSKG